MRQGILIIVLAVGLAAATAASAADSAAPVDSSAVRPVAAAPDTARTGPQPVAAQDDTLDVWRTGVSPTLAVLVSPVFPGWGQLYSRNSWRAGLAFGAQMYFLTNLLSRDQRARRSHDFAANFSADNPNHEFYLANGEEMWRQMRDFAWWSGGALLILALDAYVGVHLFNFDHDPVPVPDDWDDVFGAPGTGPLEAPPGRQVTLLQWRTAF